MERADRRSRSLGGQGDAARCRRRPCAWPSWLAGEDFQDTRAAIGRRILRELTGPRRLCPGEAAREIDVLRALAMSLTAAAGKLLPLEEVQSAFIARSKMLVTGDFVEAYLGSGHDLATRRSRR